MPNITDTLEFTSVLVSVKWDTQTIHAISARNAVDVEVGWVRSVNNSRRTWDIANEEFLILRDAIHNGSAVLKYAIEVGARVERFLDSVLPIRLHRVREWDPMHQQLSLLAITPSDVGPDDKFYFQTFIPPEGMPDVFPPKPADIVNAFSGDLSEIDASALVSGWYPSSLAAEDAGTGGGQLYTLIASYFYNGELDRGSISYHFIESGNVQYSYDYGETWYVQAQIGQILTTLFISFNELESVEIPILFPNPYGESQDVLISSVLVSYNYNSSPLLLHIDSDAFNESHSIQFRLITYQNWDSPGKLKTVGFSNLIPISELKLVSPTHIRWGDITVAQNNDAIINNSLVIGDEGRYVVAMNFRTGEMFCGHIFTDDLNSQLPGTSWMSVMVAFEKYPETTVVAAGDATAISFILEGRRSGITAADKGYLYAGGAVEEIRVVSVSSNAQTTDAGVPQFVITVDRGENGTTALAFKVGDRIRFGSATDKIRRLQILKSSGVRRPNSLRLIGHLQERIQ